MKKATITLSVVALLLLVISVLFAFSYGSLKLRVAFAHGQIDVFDSTRSKAMNSTPIEAAGYLEYAANYYPSGTKQVPGSRLDVIVETARSNAVREIIGYLRQKSGKDFGDDPQKWVEALKADTPGNKAQ